MFYDPSERRHGCASYKGGGQPYWALSHGASLQQEREKKKPAFFSAQKQLTPAARLEFRQQSVPRESLGEIPHQAFPPLLVY